MKYSGRHSKNKKRVIDIFHLPPCRSSLKLHARGSNYIAKIWRQADQKIIWKSSATWMEWRLLVRMGRWDISN